MHELSGNIEVAYRSPMSSPGLVVLHLEKIEAGPLVVVRDEVGEGSRVNASGLYGARKS